MLSEKEYELLREYQRNEKHKRNYVKITTLLMLHLGKSVEEISLCLGISPSTVSNYEKKYRCEGLKGYLVDQYKAYEGKLNVTEKASLQQEVKSKLYVNTAQVVAWVKEKWGKSYSSQGMASLLRRLGFSYKKTKLVPCKADLEQQQHFVAQFKELVAHRSEREVIYFTDAVHPQHNTRSNYAWIAQGEEKEIKSVSGRKRINLNGAMNAQNPSQILIQEDDCINAQSTWRFYQALEARHPEQETIYVICDNARYYKNKELQEKLQHSKIKQLFLPTYSPNLNLIERLWKFVRKKIIDYHFYPTFADFRLAFLAFFEQIELYKDELHRLISYNFHLPKTKTSFY